MQKHTPGPWSIVSYLDEHDRRGANVIVGHETAGARHRIHSANHTVAYTVPTLNDASLIAAAPELLAALADLLDQLEGIGIPDWHGAEGLDLLLARAAIAKATR